MSVLLLTLLLPLAGFFVVLLLPRRSNSAWPVALFFSVAALLSSLGLIGPVSKTPAQPTSVIDVMWVESANIHFHVGVDGINIWLVLLTTVLLPVGIWISQRLVSERTTTFYALLLLFEFGLIGVFSALDLFVFYVFWEVALVPMYLMVGGWGGARRGYAAVKFFVYTMSGSVMMLASIIYLANRAGTFDYTQIVAALTSGTLTLTTHEQLLLFLGFFAAFAVKVPIFPLHTWLPVTYTEAPAPATFLLAAVMSKMGAYGLLRYCLPLFPNGARQCADWIVVLAITGIIYGALIAFVQPNVKKVIAYSSLSHLGFVILGIFSFQQQGADGAVYQMVAHGISTGALFILAGYLEHRRGSMEIRDFGGVATLAPGLAAAFMIAMLASIGLPTLSNFVGEYLVLQGAAFTNFTWAAWAAVGVILSAVYMLWLYQRTFLGKPGHDVGVVTDLRTAEWAPIVPLVIIMVWLGTYTQSFMPPITAANQHLLEQSKMNLEIRVQQRTSPANVLSNASVVHAAWKETGDGR
jgi:NADH-quinone oxidoreductase subunit M